MSEKYDVAGVRAFHERDAAARLALNAFAERRNWKTETTVDSVAHQTGAGRAAVVNVFRELEKLGCGRFLVGRGGKVSRFVWGVHLGEVGRAAVGQKLEVDDNDGDDDDSIGATEQGGGLQAERADTAEDLVEHTLRLRPNLVLAFHLPEDLTLSEVERISTFLRALPLPPP